MSVEQNEQAFDRAIRGLNARDWETYGSVYAVSLVWTHVPGLSEPTKGREARVKWVQGIVGAFPDGVVEKRRSFGQGDWLCMELTFTGTHKGPIPAGGQTIPATNKGLRLPYCLVLKFDRGVVTELHEYFDQLEMLRQIGAMP